MLDRTASFSRFSDATHAVTCPMCWERWHGGACATTVAGGAALVAMPCYAHASSCSAATYRPHRCCMCCRQRAPQVDACAVRKLLILMPARSPSRHCTTHRAGLYMSTSGITAPRGVSAGNAPSAPPGSTAPSTRAPAAAHVRCRRRRRQGGRRCRRSQWVTVRSEHDMSPFGTVLQSLGASSRVLFASWCTAQCAACHGRGGLEKGKQSAMGSPSPARVS